MRKDVHLEGGFIVNQVETAAASKGISHHSIINVEFLRERSDQRLNMFTAHVRNDVPGECETHDAVQRTGKQAANSVGNAHLFKSVCNKQDNAGNFSTRSYTLRANSAQYQFR